MLNDPELIHQVRMMESDDFFILIGILVVVTIIGLIAAFMQFRRARLIEDTPTSRIRSAAQGHVELEGIARILPGDPVVAPLSKLPCVWWKYSIEKKERTYSNGRSQTRWRTIDSGTSDEYFQLVDETGDCVVDPDGATVIPNVNLTWYGHGRFPTRVPKSSSWIGFGDHRYKEARIAPDTELYALGWFRTEGGVAHSFDERGEVRELLAEWKQDKRKMAQFDTDGDGTVSPEEWEAARQKAITEVRSRLLERAINPDVHMLMRPPRRLGFILSTVPQEQLVSRSRRWAALGLGAFLISGSITVWLVTIRGLL